MKLRFSIAWQIATSLAVGGLGAGCQFCAKPPLLGKVRLDEPGNNPITPDWTAETKVDFSNYKSPNERKERHFTNVNVVVAMSGGGLRSANFGTGVLRALEALPTDWPVTNLLREVDYFSTVSGGGLSAAAYISSRVDYRSAHNGDIDGYSFVDSLSANNGRLIRMLENDYEHKLLFGLINPGNIGQMDRGDSLERALDRKVLGRKWRGSSLTLSETFVLASSPSPVRHPMWFANATLIDAGTHFVFAPDVLSRLDVRRWTHNREEMECDAGNLQELLKLPMAVGLKASASFPGAIPASTLGVGTNGWNLNLMDGGVSDNLGIRTALQILKSLTNTTRNLLIIVDAYNSTLSPLTRKRGSPPLVQTNIEFIKPPA